MFERPGKMIDVTLIGTAATMPLPDRALSSALLRSYGRKAAVAYALFPDRRAGGLPLQRKGHIPGSAVRIRRNDDNTQIHVITDPVCLIMTDRV